MAPSGQAAAAFHLRSAWSSGSLPAGTPARNNHTALGSDGAYLYFTPGYPGNAAFSRLPKGGFVWQARAPLPVPSAVDGASGVGDLGFLAGSLYTHARHSNGSSKRAVYRYDIGTNAWIRGSMFVDSDGPVAACVPVATNSILGGWLGWTPVMEVTDPLTGAVHILGHLSGNAAGGWDGSAGATDAWFIKHHGTATHAGVLARVPHTGVRAVVEVSGMPFNPGMDAAIEAVPMKYFADRHERLFILRGGSGLNDGDGGNWITDTTSNQLAVYDVTANTWSAETLPFAVGEGSEMALVDDTLYILASRTVSSQPLRWFSFRGSAPTVAALPTSSVTPNSAALNALINPRGGATSVSWEYGTSTNYGSSTPKQSLPANFDDAFPTMLLTGLVPGTVYHCRTVATNSYGRTTGDDLTFTARSPTPIELWRQTHFGSYLGLGNAADLADNDGDGLVNLLEYGLVGHPAVSNTGPLPAAGSKAGRVTLTFTRNIAATDVTLRVFGADELGGPWNALATKTGSAAWSLAPGATIDDLGTGPVTAHDAVLIASRPTRFLRLELTH